MARFNGVSTITVVPDIPEERIIEHHFQSAIKLVQALTLIYGNNPIVYFYHPLMSTGDHFHLDLCGERVYYLKSRDGKIAPDTFLGRKYDHTTVKSLEKAASIIKNNIYTYCCLKQEGTNCFYLDRQTLSAPSSALLDRSPVTEFAYPRRVLALIRILRFYRVYRQLPSRTRESIRVEGFRLVISDDQYLVWRASVLRNNQLSVYTDRDDIPLPNRYF
ncbi:hypothetical protein QAD02_020478 [Eretmocerus hayati]|uniref:Uncharacterized protein n=1 Tax=Eretmocerus hayati TaxID=131215 RepID=A0ACC2PM60_9HYME|nr:hypothetical protein QAD02_020478 [Eretmocerus hayati]